MSKLFKLNLLFFILNFGGLALGSWLMNDGPNRPWYLALNKAPWTPPGWVFGAAWSTIMICFSLYLGWLFLEYNSPQLRKLFGFALLLNISWNFIFFNQKLLAWGLFSLILLTLVIFYFFYKYRDTRVKGLRYLLMPYMIWLCLAISLNAYIVINN